MNKRTKTTIITSVICLILSLVALYTFIFVTDVSVGWKITLIIIAIFWIISGISDLIECFEKRK